MRQVSGPLNFRKSTEPPKQSHSTVFFYSFFYSFLYFCSSSVLYSLRRRGHSRPSDRVWPDAASSNCPTGLPRVCCLCCGIVLCNTRSFLPFSGVLSVVSVNFFSTPPRSAQARPACPVLLFFFPRSLFPYPCSTLATNNASVHSFTSSTFLHSVNYQAILLCDSKHSCFLLRGQTFYDSMAPL